LRQAILKCYYKDYFALCRFHVKFDPLFHLKIDPPLFGVVG